MRAIATSTTAPHSNRRGRRLRYGEAAVANAVAIRDLRRRKAEAGRLDPAQLDALQQSRRRVPLDDRSDQFSRAPCQSRGQHEVARESPAPQHQRQQGRRNCRYQRGGQHHAERVLHEVREGVDGLEDVRFGQSYPSVAHGQGGKEKESEPEYDTDDVARVPLGLVEADVVAQVHARPRAPARRGGGR